MSVTKKVSKKWENKLAKKMMGRGAVKCGEQIARAPFCEMQFLNRAQYLLSGGVADSKSVHRLQDTSFEFYQTYRPDSRVSYTRREWMSVLCIF